MHAPLPEGKGALPAQDRSQAIGGGIKTTLQVLLPAGQVLFMASQNKGGKGMREERLITIRTAAWHVDVLENRIIEVVIITGVNDLGAIRRAFFIRWSGRAVTTRYTMVADHTPRLVMFIPIIIASTFL